MLRIGGLGVMAALLALGAAACTGGEGPAQVDKTLKPVADSAPQDAVARGRYLVRAVGCDDCHSPKKMGPEGPSPDPAMLLAGHPATEPMPPAPALPQGPWLVVGSGSLTAWSGPWGVSYAANLTPDPDTGLGNWTEAMFVNALRSGKHMGASRPILPPMPWQAYGNMTDDDLKAIFAYLRTIPAVSNRVPDPVFASQP